MWDEVVASINSCVTGLTWPGVVVRGSNPKPTNMRTGCLFGHPSRLVWILLAAIFFNLLSKAFNICVYKCTYTSINQYAYSNWLILTMRVTKIKHKIMGLSEKLNHGASCLVSQWSSTMKPDKVVEWVERPLSNLVDHESWSRQTNRFKLILVAT